MIEKNNRESINGGLKHRWALNPKVDTPLFATNGYSYTILPGRKSWPLNRGSLLDRSNI